MALQECGLNLNQASRELQPHGSTGFPCAGYACRCTERTEDMIPWHWHEEMEIAYVEQGQAVVKAASKTFLLNPGELVVINSNVIHFAAGAPECRLHSLVFHPRLITGTEDSVFAETYLRPLLSCGSFLGYQMDGQDGEKAAGWFRRVFRVGGTALRRSRGPSRRPGPLVRAPSRCRRRRRPAGSRRRTWRRRGTGGRSRPTGRWSSPRGTRGRCW